MTKRADDDIIRGGLDIVTDKTKKKRQAILEPRPPSAARLKRGKVDSKAYIVLYACSLCHTLYLDLVSSLETQEFILSLKTFVARKGRPDKFTLKIVLHLLVQLGG